MSPAADGLRCSVPPALLKRVIDFMHAHLEENLTLRQLAAIACRSSFHFCRAFHEATGLPPYRYLTCCRIDRAKTLLRTTSTPIALVSQKVGFRSARQFSAAFRNFTGMSPRRYRLRSRLILH